MPTFAEAVQQVDATGLPVVEGFAVKLRDGATEAAVAAALAGKFPPPRYGWQADDMPDGWRIYRVSGDALPPLGEAWDAVRAVKGIAGVEAAEPMLLTKPPVTNGSDAQAAFQLWGKVSDDRLTQITTASKPLHWSLTQLGVRDSGAPQDAWSIWKAKHGNEPPGKGILVAHPDTGYTRHARLLPHLLPHPEDPNLYGRNFVDRKKPDGFDPMEDQSFAAFPGHGTGTASVIAAGNDSEDNPWGVAPGAQILPLRVSSSVIHLSFQNLCAAFVEAMAQNAHVISMSLGGPLGSDLLNTLIRKALDQGIIVVAAAGNNAPTVVFPARLPGVLAVAASNAVAAPWRFSGLGGEVAITAPGELVWHDWERLDPTGKPTDDRTNGSGTSFATANVAGLAALWLSYHDRKNLIENHCDNRPELLPFLFRLCLERSSDGKPDFLRGGKGGFGVGIAKADRLLTQPLPSAAEAEAARAKILAGKADSIVTFPVNSWWTILTLPTLTENGPVLADTPASQAERGDRLASFMAGKDGLAPNLDDDDRSEIGGLAAMDVLLSNALAKVSQGARNCISAAAVRRYLLRKDVPLSKVLRDKLTGAQTDAQKAWIKSHGELSLEKAYKVPSAEKEDKKTAYSVPPPPMRRLRAFAFDPSLTTSSSEVAINEITIPVVFERELEPGPVGDYLAVVDVDPASDCAYAPVDLNHPFLLAQDGLPRSEGNPQFHQQMVYAVAMKTISHFEEALGRPIFWSPLRPWDPRSDDKDHAVLVKSKVSGKDDPSDQFVQHLRLYPHALREQNAYYSPQKRAILFGYFPAGDGDPGAEYPGGVVFTCLAHDIIAHETTHAILDGMHVRYTEPTNPDVFAFHEAFADIVALLQRFTYAELLRDQIARVRGKLDAGTLMTRLALQFGLATGRHQALRDAMGHVVDQARERVGSHWRDQLDPQEMNGSSEKQVTVADAAYDLSDEEKRAVWKRFQANPSLLKEVEEPHARGSFLVAAVFDAYLTIYEERVADLRRIATGGTGVLPDGDLHPDLVNRMAGEAAKSARHVLRMCIRAMDYVPPTDITFGEFLRGLITADSDLVPEDDRRYRVAFIEAFRKWGIYPRDVRTLSEESLRWTQPDGGRIHLFEGREEGATINQVRRALFDWQPGESRNVIFEKIKDAQGKLQKYFRRHRSEGIRKVLEGIDTERSFQVANLRPARRIGPRGEFLTEMVVEILQNKDAPFYDKTRRDEESKQHLWAAEAHAADGETEEPAGGGIPFRGGITLIIGMDNNKYVVRYAIYKRPDSATREARQRDFLLRASGSANPDAAEYSSENLPAGWYTRDEVRAEWFKDRVSEVEDMRASSCACRRGSMELADKKALDKAAKQAGAQSFLTEPFALLHRG